MRARLLAWVCQSSVEWAGIHLCVSSGSAAMPSVLISVLTMETGVPWLGHSPSPRELPLWPVSQRPSGSSGERKLCEAPHNGV
jgi:hypothetical protein